MPINQLYNTWKTRILQMRPKERKTRINNFVWFLIGIYQSRSVYLSRIAVKIPGQVKLLSIVQRLSRFLENPAIDFREWYEPIAREWLKRQAKHIHQVRLIVDGTKIGFAHQLLMVSLAYRKRAIPIAWTWVKYVRGHSTAQVQLELLGYVRTLIPEGASVLLVGDCEFGAVEVLQQLERWEWKYVLRQSGSTHIYPLDQKEWRDFGSWVEKPGKSKWLGIGWLTQSKTFLTNLLVHWKVGEKEAWCLATNLDNSCMALKAYARRMWIDEMFGDLKSHGFDIEHTMLRDTDKLSRLTMIVAFLYVWAISVGTKAIRNGQRDEVDRKDRRDLSIFQIGIRIIERFLINGLLCPIILCDYK